MSLDRNHENVLAWNALYARTKGLVWGAEPVGFLPVWAARLQALVGPADAVLEAGVGEGRNLAALEKLGASLYACDASVEALHKIPERLQGQVSLAQCELAQTPYADGFFRLLVLIDVFETLPDPRSVLRELHRITAPGGYLLANIPDADDEIAGVEMEPLPEGGFLFRGRFFYRFYSVDEAVALARAEGWDVVESEVCQWMEEPHPEFRPESHAHTSRVFLFQRCADLPGEPKE